MSFEMITSNCYNSEVLQGQGRLFQNVVRFGKKIYEAVATCLHYRSKLISYRGPPTYFTYLGSPEDRKASIKSVLPGTSKECPPAAAQTPDVRTAT